MLLVLMLLVTACGQKTKGTEKAGSQETTTGDTNKSGSDKDATSEGETLEPYEITWYLGGTPQKDHDLVEAEINKITKEKINTTVKFKFIDWSNYSQQMQVLMSTGEKMDLVFTSNWANDYLTGVNKGAYQEINMEDLQKYAPHVIEGVPASAWDAAKVGGKLYAMINTQVIARWPAVMLQNKYMDKYNFDISKVNDLADLTPLFEDIVDNEEGIYPINAHKNTNILSFYITKMGLEYFSATNPFGLYLNDDGLEVVNIYDTPEMKEFFYLLRDWNNKGIIRADASTVTDMKSEISNGLVASVFAVNNPDTLINFARDMGVSPKEMTAKPLSEPVLSTGSVIATMNAISTNSKNPERCMMLFNLMYDKEDTRIINLLTYGIEDKHYTKVEDDLIELIPNSGYLINCGWEYGNLFNCYRTSPDQPKWYPVGPDINNKAITSKSLGFNIDTKPIKSELAQMTSIFDEFMPALLTGSVEVDGQLEKFLNKLEKAGSAKVQKEIQKQINAWKSAK